MNQGPGTAKHTEACELTSVLSGFISLNLKLTSIVFCGLLFGLSLSVFRITASD